MTFAEILERWEQVSPAPQLRGSYRLTALVTNEQIASAKDAVITAYLMPYLDMLPATELSDAVAVTLFRGADTLAYCVLLRRRAVVTRYTASEPVNEHARDVSRLTAEVKQYRTAGLTLIRQGLAVCGVDWMPARYAPILDDVI